MDLKLRFRVGDQIEDLPVINKNIVKTLHPVFQRYKEKYGTLKDLVIELSPDSNTQHYAKG